MEGVALDFAARHSGIQEAKIEAAVVAHQNGAFAAIGFDRLAQAAEDFAERMLFADRLAQRVIQLDAGKLQGGLLDIGAFEGLDTEEVGVLRIEEAAFVHADDGRGDLQQRVSGGIETAGLDIDHYRQVTAKACRHRVAWSGRQAAIQFVVVMFFTHTDCSSRRQRSFSPARSGMTRCSPSGSSVGATQSSRTRVMRSVLRGRP